jgi:hypothetical protein
VSSIYFSNLQLEDDTEYFLYIGELKNYGLNHFLKEALARAFNRRFDFIAIVPDIAEQYNYDNLIVINPLVHTYACQYGNNVNCRVSASGFMAAVSESGQVRSLIRRLLRRQDHVYLYMYESLTQMTLDDMDGVSILGPDKHVAATVNNKRFQLTRLADQVPLVPFHLCTGYADLLKTADSLWDTWTDGIFVTKEYSAAGINSTVAYGRKDIEDKFHGQDVPYIISRYLPHVLDPTVLAVVAGEDQVFIAGVADQCIENKNRFTGSVFPTRATPAQVRELEQYTRTVGTWLARQGYRGIFGCDYIITETGDIRFLEINGRKQGTTLEFCCTLEQHLPPAAPNLPELEFYAVTEGLFPADAREMKPGGSPLHWGTFNYKIHEPVKTESYIPQGAGEREAFRKVARGRLKKDFLILEHTGSDFVIAQGAFIGRIVALGHDHDSVAQGIRQGCKTIELTFTRPLHTETI